MRRYLVSVIICTYKPDVGILQRVIDSIAQQIFTFGEVEYILVINGDNTDGIQKLVDFRGLPFRCITEELVGLSHARRRGIRECAGDFVVFVDDDNFLDPDFFQIAMDCMLRDSSVGVLGGRSEATSCVPLPYWFHSVAHKYAVGVQAIHSGYVTQRGYLWGAGMFVRGDLLRKIIANDVPSLLTDRKGTELSSGGDSEICKWYIAAGYELYYEERAIFHHYMSPPRLTKEYFQKMDAGHNASSRILRGYDLAIAMPRLFSRQWFIAVMKAYLGLLLSAGRGIANERLAALGCYGIVSQPEIAKAAGNVRKLRSIGLSSL